MEGVARRLGRDEAHHHRGHVGRRATRGADERPAAGADARLGSNIAGLGTPQKGKTLPPSFRKELYARYRPQHANGFEE